MVVCLFVATLSDFGLLKKTEALIKLRKMILRKKLSDVRLGNCQPLSYFKYSADLLDLQRCN